MPHGSSRTAHPRVRDPRALLVAACELLSSTTAHMNTVSVAGDVLARAEYFFRAVVVASSSVVRLGSTGISRKAAPTRKRSGPSRIATRGFPERSVSGVLRTCLVAFPRCDAAAGRPGGHGQFSCLGRSCITPGQATNHWDA